ncbi:hypothetical protein ACVILI_006630 [Mesorhizobium sp. USDA 4775]
MTHDTPTPRPFVILAMPRTGTHYLEELLNEHPTVLSNGELLNEYDTNWPGKDRLLRPDRELLEHAYVRYPTRDHKNVTHIGCKINEPQFRDRPAFFAEMIRWPRTQGHPRNSKRIGIATIFFTGKAKRPVAEIRFRQGTRLATARQIVDL